MAETFRILTLNSISPLGLQRFPAARYSVGADVPQPDAIIVCDMWDSHHCLNAVRRCVEVAPRMNRVQGILDAVKRFYPDFDVTLPPKEKIWYGYRPCSADGLPYIGRIKKYNNITIATGHSMLGLSLGAGTGKLVDEIINDKKVSMDISFFDPLRFS